MMLPIEPPAIPPPVLAERRQVYTQESGESIDQIDIEAIDEGAGHYLVIKTERWALDPEEIDLLAQMLRDTLAGLGDTPTPTGA